MTLRPRAAISGISNAKEEARKELMSIGTKGLYLFPLVDAILEPNLFLDQELSNEFLNQEYQDISPNIGVVRKGDIIITRNSTISKDSYQKLVSLKDRFEADNSSHQ